MLIFFKYWARFKIIMSYYTKHIFMCINQREDGKECCNDKKSLEIFDYTKKKCISMKLQKKGGIRVNKAGCLDRCAEGPVMVIYPDNIWYKYKDKNDIDEIIDKHIINNKVVTKLKI